MTTIFRFGKHVVPFTDIHDINVVYKYHDMEIYVDLELNGGAQLSLNLPDSLTFMEQFLKKIREEKDIQVQA
ncbi:MAG TPA: hypothetical protein VK147_01230 [Candidatus Didemnitutus sp.]|nr:hypothetical protein [Candidatus Didemnitutus sp.]